MEIQLGYWRWRLFRWNEHPNPYLDRPDLALTWLRQFQNDAAFIDELRDLMRSPGGAVYGPADTEVILRGVADQMASGAILPCIDLCGPTKLATAMGLPGDTDDPDLSELQSQPSPPAPAPPSDPPADPPATLDPATDPEAQAQAMKDAAETGSPLVEECQKAS
jgi:hypothetical protein